MCRHDAERQEVTSSVTIYCKTFLEIASNSVQKSQLASTDFILYVLMLKYGATLIKCMEAISDSNVLNAVWEVTPGEIRVNALMDHNKVP